MHHLHSSTQVCTYHRDAYTISTRDCRPGCLNLNCLYRMTSTASLRRCFIDCCDSHALPRFAVVSTSNRLTQPVLANSMGGRSLLAVLRPSMVFRGKRWRHYTTCLAPCMQPLPHTRPQQPMTDVGTGVQAAGCQCLTARAHRLCRRNNVFVF